MEKEFTIRRTPRSACRCAIRYFGHDYLGTGTVWDLSMGGGRVTGSFPVKVATELILHLQLPDELGQEWFWVDKAIVRWSTGKTFGIEIISLEQGSRQFLAYALGEFDEG